MSAASVLADVGLGLGAVAFSTVTFAVVTGVGRTKEGLRWLYARQ